MSFEIAPKMALVVGHAERAFAEQVADQRARGCPEATAQHALLGLALDQGGSRPFVRPVWIVVPARRASSRPHVVMSHRDACI